MNLFDLSGKVAVITGASRGLGRAMALGMAEAGATVVAVGRDMSALEQTGRAVERGNGRARLVRADVNSEESVGDLVEEVASDLGRIDILVNNAGIARLTKAANIGKAEWDMLLATNLTSVFTVSQAFGKMMLDRKSGSIINIGSVLGVRGSVGSLHYCATKAAVANLTRTLALEWAAFNVRVNCIAPGYFGTEMIAALQKNQRLNDPLLQKIPMKRYGDPAEIVGAALFLASDASSYVTGSTLFVDGGYTI